MTKSAVVSALAAALKFRSNPMPSLAYSMRQDSAEEELQEAAVVADKKRKRIEEQKQKQQEQEKPKKKEEEKKKKEANQKPKDHSLRAVVRESLEKGMSEALCRCYALLRIVLQHHRDHVQKTFVVGPAVSRLVCASSARSVCLNSDQFAQCRRSVSNFLTAACTAATCDARSVARDRQKRVISLTVLLEKLGEFGALVQQIRRWQSENSGKLVKLVELVLSVEKRHSRVHFDENTP